MEKRGQGLFHEPGTGLFAFLQSPLGHLSTIEPSSRRVLHAAGLASTNA